MTSRSEAVKKVWIAWSQPERNHLESLIGEVPLAIAAKRYNIWAAANDYPPRTITAVSSFCNRNNLSTEVIGEMLKARDVARILGICPSRVRYWIRHQWIPAKRSGSFYVARAQLVRLARSKPHVFYGVPRERLYHLLEDEKLAEQIAHNWTAPPKLRPVRCVELQQMWPSVAAAAADRFCHRRSITRAIEKGRTCLEHHWEWAS